MSAGTRIGMAAYQTSDNEPEIDSPRADLAALRRLLGPLAVVATVGMFLVLVMGATVTSTGSAAGCGRSWPLCNGQFVPELATATLIEYSHRAVTGVEGLLVAALGLGAWVAWPRRTVRALVLLMVGTLLLQAGLG